MNAFSGEIGGKAILVEKFQDSAPPLPTPKARKPEPPEYIYSHVPRHGYHKDEFGVEYSGGMAL